MKLSEHLRPMLFGQQLVDALAVIPKPIDISNLSPADRLQKLQMLNDVFIPSLMSVEIYSKLYLATVRALDRKDNLELVKLQNENFKNIREGLPLSSGVGSGDSFSMLGTPGIGKSSAIGRAVSVITGNKLIRIEKPFQSIIPILIIQAPFDSSPKTLLVEIARKVDEQIGTNYLKDATRVTINTSGLISLIANVLINHCAVLVIEEAQNFVLSKTGRFMMGALLQLINASRISMVFVGTPKAKELFEGEEFLARRTLGSEYTRMDYDSEFKRTVEILYNYQFVTQQSNLDESMLSFLYQASQGVMNSLVALLIGAQEIAILNGTEILNLTTLNKAFVQRLGVLENYRSMRLKTPSKSILEHINKDPEKVDLVVYDSERLIQELSFDVRKSNGQIDIGDALKGNVPMIELDISGE
jgi:hypothetical protein